MSAQVSKNPDRSLLEHLGRFRSNQGIPTYFVVITYIGDLRC